MTAQEDPVAAAQQQVFSMFFALAGDPDSPATADQADNALAALDEALTAAGTVTA
jgi:hypothetical protein